MKTLVWNILFLKKSVFKVDFLSALAIYFYMTNYSKTW